MPKSHKQKKSGQGPTESKQARLDKKRYFQELERLQLELVKLHELIELIVQMSQVRIDLGPQLPGGSTCAQLCKT